MKDTGPFWNESVVQAILTCKSAQLADLAKSAGLNPAMVFRGMDFRGVDLRGQDLRGMDLKEASFEGAIVDRETRLDGGAIPITNKDKLISLAHQLIDCPSEYFEYEKLLHDFRDILSKAIDVCFFTGTTLTVYELVDSLLKHAYGAPVSNRIINTERGYIRRSVFLLPITSLRSGLRKSLLSTIRKRAPEVLSPQPYITWQEQIDFPFAQLPSRDEIDDSLNIREILRRFNQVKRVTDLWLVFEGDLTPELGDEIEKIRAMKARVHFLVSVPPGPAEGRRALTRGRTAELHERKYHKGGSDGFLSEIEKASNGALRFSAGARMRASKIVGQESRGIAILDVMLRAVERSRTTPIVVAAKDYGRPA